MPSFPLRERWRIHLPSGQSVTVVHAQAATAKERAAAASPRHARWLLSSALVGGADHGADLLAAFGERAAGLHVPQAPGAGRAPVGPALRAIEAQRLLVIEDPAPSYQRGPDPAPIPRAAAAPASEQKAKHWIGIHVGYEDGSPFEGFLVVETPDGARDTHRLTSGAMRLSDLTPGTCLARVREVDPAAVEVVAESRASGPARGPAPAAEMCDKQLCLVDEDTGDPVAGHPYCVEVEGRKVVFGYTDDAGMTERFGAGPSPRSFVVWWGDDALAKEEV